MNKAIPFLFFLSVSVTSIAQGQITNQLQQGAPKLSDLLYTCKADRNYLLELADTNHIKNIQAKINSATRSGQNILTCGRFDLIFMDCINGTRVGFDDTILGADYRNCACGVANFIQSIFNIPAGDGSQIEIVFTDSWHPGNPAPDHYTLAVGGAYQNSPAFVAGTPGFYGGNVYDHFTTGTDPVVGTPDGQIRVNFSQAFVTDTPPGCNWFDLKGVLLHEFTHTMGWASAVDGDTAFVPFCIYGSNRFTLYDKYFLHSGNITTGPFTQVVDGTNPANPHINPAINNVVDTPLWMHNILRNSPTQNQNQPVMQNMSYMGNPPINILNMISHLGDYQTAFGDKEVFAPGFTPLYVMGPTFMVGQSKTYTLQEIRDLQVMGYSLSSSFLNSNTLNPAFTNSQIINNRHPYTTRQFPDKWGEWYYHYPIGLSEMDDNSIMPRDTQITNCQTFTLALASDAKLRDADSDPMWIYPNSIYNIRGCSTGSNDHGCLAVTSNASGDIITYTPRPDFTGRAQFGFHLYDGKEKGAYVYYTIDVSACHPCGNNLVINGDMEKGMEVKTTTNLTVDNATITAYRNWKFLDYYGSFFTDGTVYGGNNSSIVRNSEGCIPGIGQFTSSHFFPGDCPLQVNQAGDRYYMIYQQAVNGNTFGGNAFGSNVNNFFTLCQPLTACNSYNFQMDISSPAITQLTIGFRNQAMPHDFFLPLEDTIGTITINDTTCAWQHISIPFTYVGQLPSNYLVLQLDNSKFAKVLVDNFVLTDTVIDWQPVIDSASGILTSSSATNYQWNLNGVAIAGATAQTYTPTENGLYTVTHNYARNCNETSNGIYVIISGINALSAGDNIQVTPNPGDGFFNLTFSTDKGLKHSTVAVYNVLSQLVFKKNAPAQTTGIDLSSQPAGVYTVKVSGDNFLWSKQIIKK